MMLLLSMRNPEPPIVKRDVNAPRRIEALKKEWVPKYRYIMSRVLTYERELRDEQCFQGDPDKAYLIQQIDLLKKTLITRRYKASIRTSEGQGMASYLDDEIAPALMVVEIQFELNCR